MGDSANRTLWCGNLTSAVCDEILFDLFLQAGPLEKVFIPKDRDGCSKGYGFITFKHECSVPYAMELMKGTTLYGRTINLQNRTGAKVDSMPNDSRNSYHQRSTSLQDQGRPHLGPVPNFDQAQSLNALYDLAGLLSGNPSFPQMIQNMNRQSHHQNHQRSRSYNMGGRYYDGNNREERRGYHGNSNGRQPSRDNDYRGRARDDDQYDSSRSSNYRDRDRDRSRSNNRPYDNRRR